LNIEDYEFPGNFPVLVENGFFIYPFMIVPLFIEGESNLKAVEFSLKENLPLMIINEKKKNKYYDIGVIGTIIRKVPLNNGTVKILFQGINTAKILGFIREDGFLSGKIDLIQKLKYNKANTDALSDILKENISNYIKLSNHIPPDLLQVIIDTKDPYRLSEIIASSLKINYTEAYNLFAEENIENRLTKLMELITKEINSFELKANIKSKAYSKMEKHNKEYLLREQLKEINKELNHDKSKINDIKKFHKKLKKIKPFINKKGFKEIKKQIDRYSTMSHDSGSEASMIQNYIEVALSVPFNKNISKDIHIEEIEKVLDAEHYSLKEPKERIVEHFATREFLESKGIDKKLNSQNGNILCFVGPPGVGKTSLANSIASALKRPLVRIPLGGMEDINELKGHRRTYIGAMAGRIVQGLIDAKANNPVIVLDEIDKISKNHRGDPSSVFLEILDPAQNHTFRDYYLNFDIDLSNVLFIATSNEYGRIPYALRDRMESIFIHSYTPQEKLSIATKYLLPQEMKQHGLSKSELKISDVVMKKIIDSYTKEAGVRGLRRVLAKLCRKSIKIFISEKKKSMSITLKNLEDFLDKEKYDFSKLGTKNTIGVVNGLAWTAVGGDLLKIEAMYLSGKGIMQITGNLGDVMKESSRIALSVVKKIFASKTLNIGISYDDGKKYTLEEVYKKIDLHIHIPEGATPKDGPSAGITLACVIASVYSGKKVNRFIAMTGELNLSGEVLPIGGLKEKLIAAFKSGIKKAIIPQKNYDNDLKDIPSEVKESMEIVGVSSIESVLEQVLV